MPEAEASCNNDSGVSSSASSLPDLSSSACTCFFLPPDGAFDWLLRRFLKQRNSSRKHHITQPNLPVLTHTGFNPGILFHSFEEKRRGNLEGFCMWYSATADINESSVCLPSWICIFPVPQLVCCNAINFIQSWDKSGWKKPGYEASPSPHVWHTPLNVPCSLFPSPAFQLE